MKLYDQLYANTKEVLLNLGKLYGLKGISKLKKAELCMAVEEAMCHSLEKVLEKLLPEDYEAFAELTKVDKKPFTVENMNNYRTILALRLAYVEHKEWIQIPTELKVAFKEISSDLNKVRCIKEKQTIRKKVFGYERAAMNLYGMMPIEDFIELCMTYEGIEVEDGDGAINEKIEAIIEAIYNQISIDGRSFVEEDYLMDESFNYVPEEEILYFKEQTKNKIYYRPDQETFLRYADEYYYEETEEIKEVKAYLNSKFPFRHRDIEEVIEEWQLDVRINILPTIDDIRTLMGFMEAYDLVFKDFKTLQKFTDLLMKAHNSTRLWINRGNTPKVARLATSQQNGKDKVGRNDPCPCGSGNKYKKCCGK